MIVQMHKYTFLVFYKEYNDFLEQLREIGVLHVAGKGVALTDEIKQKYKEINRFENVIQFLRKREPESINVDSVLSSKEILDDIDKKRVEFEEQLLKLEELNKELVKTKPWGKFSPEIIRKLEAENILLDFYTTTRKKYQEFVESNLPVEVVFERGNQLVFAIIQKSEEKITVDAEHLDLPANPYTEIKKRISQVENRIRDINNSFDEFACNSLAKLERDKTELTDSLSFDNVILNTSKEAEEKLMVLEGWVPKSKKESIDNFLKENNILYVTSRAKPSDNIPVLLKNNRFSKLFEPIGSMFSLPDYAELDLTVFFAPFFMMFFGFCLGDAGYGLLFLVGAGLYKFKATKAQKPYLTLIQLLGVATIIFGTISGTFFGVNLIETEIALTDSFRNLFLDPNKMFNLSMILGGIQIIFGLFIKAANQTKQFGFSYSLATYGWIIILLGGISYAILSGAEIIPKNDAILYAILGVGGFFVLFFSDPGVNVFARVGKGIWDVYSMVTGIFGDLLSYIRLFALGLSSAILGFVINDIGLQILGSSKILGPVFFVIFLLLGHTLNILISSLGSFVHPMRLTFVEFYKNAGFKGGGEEYKPFKK